MYVCICKGITEQQLKEKLFSHQGNTSKVLKSLGIGSDCGTCLKDAIDIINNDSRHDAHPSLPKDQQNS